MDQESGTAWLRKPVTVGIGAFLAASIFAAAPEDWLGVALKLALIVAAAATVLAWSRREGWSQRHQLALACGAVLTYAWLGVVLSFLKHEDDLQLSLVGNAVFAGLAILLLVAARKRLTY